MASLNKLSPGQTVYNTIRRRMGNTTMRETAIFSIKVIEIDLEKRRVFASWNGNKPEWFYERRVRTWKIKYPSTKQGLYAPLTTDRLEPILFKREPIGPGLGIDIPKSNSVKIR